MPNCQPGDYLIRLNRQPASADELLTDGCRVSITPTKIEGATNHASLASPSLVASTCS